MTSRPAKFSTTVTQRESPSSRRIAAGSPASPCAGKRPLLLRGNPTLKTDQATRLITLVSAGRFLRKVQDIFADRIKCEVTAKAAAPRPPEDHRYNDNEDVLAAALSRLGGRTDLLEKSGVVVSEEFVHRDSAADISVIERRIAPPLTAPFYSAPLVDLGGEDSVLWTSTATSSSSAGPTLTKNLGLLFPPLPPGKEKGKCKYPSPLSESLVDLSVIEESYVAMRSLDDDLCAR